MEENKKNQNKKSNTGLAVATAAALLVAGGIAAGITVQEVVINRTLEAANVVEAPASEEPEEPILSYTSEEPVVAEPVIIDEPVIVEPIVVEPVVIEEEPIIIEEEPEAVIPTIDPETVYDFKYIRALLKEYPEELNGSYCTVKVVVQGSAFGVPGCCFFNDVTDKTYDRGHIDQEDMKDMLVRFDVGDNNAGFSRTEITTISGYISYEHNTYLGVDLIVIE